MDHPCATMSIDDVRCAVAAAHARIESLLAEYVTRPEGNGAPERHLRGVVAAKGQARYVALSHVLEGRVGDDPNEFTSFYDGTWWNVYFPYRRRYEVSRRFAVHPHTAKARAHPFLEWLSWWPPDDDSERPRFPNLGDRSYFLRDVLASDGIRVLPLQERIAGRPCHVVELPACDRLWIDGARGTLVRREFLSGGDAPRLIAQYELSEYRMEGKGAWLPHRLRRTTSPNARTVTYEVVRYEVNRVSDELFGLDPPPGAIVYDRDTDLWHQVPGGLAYLDEIASRAKQFSEASPETPGTRTTGDLRLRSAMSVLTFVGSGAVYFVLRLIWKMGRRRASKSPMDGVAAAGKSVE
ncbi:MAG TPA: hypothetical protein VND64_06805 [Pirellulales bacterium]|nr:hypothetical protein [Pirellulales bacterium]